MVETYQSHGVSFEYPDDWEITEQQDAQEVTITVQSPETSFWLLTVFFDQPDPEKIAEAALDAFRQEYDDLDIYEGDDNICDENAVAWDLEFRAMEVYNSAWVRTFQTDLFSALVLYQANDLELEDTTDTMRGMTRSLGYYYE